MGETEPFGFTLGEVYSPSSIQRDAPHFICSMHLNPQPFLCTLSTFQGCLAEAGVGPGCGVCGWWTFQNHKDNQRGHPLAGTSHHSQIFSQLFLKTAPLTSLRLSVFSHEIETYTHPGFLLTLTLMTAFYLLKHKALCLNYRPSAASRDKRRPLMSCTFQSSLKLPWRQQVFNSGPPRRESYCPPWGDMPFLDIFPIHFPSQVLGLL